jgi:nucleotide-binding universal stress UspA family protein
VGHGVLGDYGGQTPAGPRLQAWRESGTYRYGADCSEVDFAVEAAILLSQVVDKVLGAEAAEVLTAASRDAAILAVGNRGCGAFGMMLLGSTNQRCGHQATVPLAVVRHPA